MQIWYQIRSVQYWLFISSESYPNVILCSLFAQVKFTEEQKKKFIDTNIKAISRLANNILYKNQFKPHAGHLITEIWEE
jgi:hypothetical protein